MKISLIPVQFEPVILPVSSAKSIFEIRGEQDQFQTLTPKVTLTGESQIKIANSQYDCDSGRIQFDIESGEKEEKATIRIQAADMVEYVHVYVTDLNLTLLDDVPLSHEEEQIFKMLYYKFTELNILREFGGGLSGNRVIQVQAKDDKGVFLTQIVKIGSAFEMSDEKSRYETHFQNRIATAAPISGYVEQNNRAGIIYGDANASSCLQPVLPFAKFFLQNQDYQIEVALFSILLKGLSNVYRYYQVKNTSYFALLNRYLPENMMLQVDNTNDQTEIIFSEEEFSQDADTCLQLAPVDVERSRYQCEKGDIVQLNHFLVTKIQSDDLNLQDAQRNKFKIKVTFDSEKLPYIRTYDHVSIRGTLMDERYERIEFAVNHCLTNHGFEIKESLILHKEFKYPDPVPLFKQILKESCDITYSSIHGDLHWENVMIESPSNWWLIDYGLSESGPVIFDFIKLELYLRIAVLSKEKDIQVEHLILFEDILLNNPFGDLPEDTDLPPVLSKALSTIQCIRRLAKPYLIPNFESYLKFLFGYALSLSKYYPIHEKWTASSDEQQKAKLEKSQRQFLFALIPVITLGKYLKWQTLSKKASELNLSFVPMGSHIQPEPGKIALDVGSRCEPGVIDHHIGEIEAECTASLIWHRPELIMDHINNNSENKLEWILHSIPDFDAICSLYMAWCYTQVGYYPPGAKQLQEYTRLVDQGTEFLETNPWPERTPYSLFEFYLSPDNHIQERNVHNDKRVMKGIEVLHYLCHQEALGEHPFFYNHIPSEHPFTPGTIGLGKDRMIFNHKDEKLGKSLQINLMTPGGLKKIKGICLEAPHSRFFKTWARREGYSLLIVRWPSDDKPDHRIVISVPPSMQNALKGLGQALEVAETKKRKKIGKVRSGPPRWDDVKNCDPWYDGRSPLHAYTIVDAPHEGTVLSMEEVTDIIKKSNWREK